MNARPNPYIGPTSFKTGDTLYGRDRELNQLEALLIAERIVLLHSPSGAGKTSLIHAGLIPHMREDFLILPPVRVNQEPPTDGEPVNRYLWSTLLSLEETQPENKRRPFSELATLSLDAYLRNRPRPETAPDVDLLIFDQFEEILTTTPADQQAKHAFFEQLATALKDRSRWALFAVREDYLGALAPYLRPIPNRLKTTYRLDLLKTDAAREAIQRPPSKQGVTFSEAAADQLVRDLSRIQIQDMKGVTHEEQGEYVEPVQLQVVCFNLWKNLNDDVNEINVTDLSTGNSVDEALAQYYTDIVKNVSAKTGVSERAIRTWFDKKLLIGPADQPVRGQVRKGAGNTEGLANSVLDELVDAHIIRAEPRAGSTWYELAHDRLIKPIHGSNQRWLEQNLRLFQRQAELWVQQNRPDELLLRGKELGKAKGESKKVDYLTADELAFIKAGQALQTRRLQSLLMIAIGVVSFLIFIIVLNYPQINREILRLQAVQSEMVVIPAGDYSVGKKMEIQDEPNWYLPLQTLHLPAFSIDSYPVTNYRYNLCIQAGICARPNAQSTTYEGSLNADKPVVNLTKLGVAQFCSWLGQHLPSDSQWEIAVDLHPDIWQINQDARYQADNFFEWTNSPYDQNNPEATDVLTKKGGYFDSPIEFILTFRQSADANLSNNTTGFRCVKDQ